MNARREVRNSLDTGFKTLEQERSRSLKMLFRPPLLPSRVLSLVCSWSAKIVVWLPDWHVVLQAG